MSDPVNVNEVFIDKSFKSDKTEYEIKISDTKNKEIFDIVSNVKIY